MGAIRHKVNSWMFGVALLLVFLMLRFLLITSEVNLYSSDKSSDEVRSFKYGDYIGLDGEIVEFPFRCKSCALVGMSDSDFGEEIDENHSCIFRLGFCPTRGMERHVGSRTTARVVDSFRFYPFLKRPLKLAAGPFASEFWFLFDRRTGDISHLHGPRLEPLVRKHDSHFLWLSRSAERQVRDSLFQKNRTVGGREISALWFALKVLEDAGCKSLNVYGLPDPQICKRSLNVSKPSLYWENSSSVLCQNGVDASFTSNKGVAPISHLPTIVERRFLLPWARQHNLDINFLAPSWPS
ncbi:alpha-N-acetylgalactosaminide alpha-2,6-sialyltransferase 3-like isoform X2 [Stegodyphus dumicola]|uniref:alpha-N-acetylgalactosaminide alpha-2,6-sialyltransferase 3-like isoform X2 n=1 Tax=Stegodyphus dumicola TaxID=202533 RepID=UPI0015B32A78|nr:alpha-N-acetylgalactosaminide alpha-2,6-sialyltransferase 3-like isoform X2 [Stegodyphus dumicola]